MPIKIFWTEGKNVFLAKLGLLCVYIPVPLTNCLNRMKIGQLAHTVRGGSSEILLRIVRRQEEAAALFLWPLVLARGDTRRPVMPREIQSCVGRAWWAFDFVSRRKHFLATEEARLLPTTLPICFCWMKPLRWRLGRLERWLKGTGYSSRGPGLNSWHYIGSSQ